MVAQIDREYVSAARLGTLRRLLSYAAFEGRPATTRGQWVNPAVRAHLEAALRLPVSGSPDRPIFLLGVGRSGTTLLGKLLGAHEHVGFLNEPKLMWNLIDPGEDISGFYPTVGEPQVRRTAADVDDALRARAQKLYRYYEIASRSARVVDKYCELTYRREYLRTLFPDCRLIAIVRRPSSMMQSVSHWSAQHRRTDEDWWGVGDRKWTLLHDQVLATQPDADLLLKHAASADDAVRALLEWIVGMRALLEPCAGAGLDAIVRYEELVARPTDTAREVLRAADLPGSDRVLQLAQRSVRPDLRDEGDADVPDGLQDAVAGLLSGLGYSGG